MKLPRWSSLAWLDQRGKTGTASERWRPSRKLIYSMTVAFILIFVCFTAIYPVRSQHKLPSSVMGATRIKDLAQKTLLSTTFFLFLKFHILPFSKILWFFEESNIECITSILLFKFLYTANFQLDFFVDILTQLSQHR